MRAEELKARFAGVVFDEIELDVEADSLVGFALACGETQAKFTNPEDPDFQAVPNYTTRFHGARFLPSDFPIAFERCFDAGKAVEVFGTIRPGDRIVGRSELADIYEKTGRSGAMLFIVHRMNFYNQRGEHLSRVDWRLVERDTG
jgi:hypothetical protein